MVVECVLTINERMWVRRYSTEGRGGDIQTTRGRREGDSKRVSGTVLQSVPICAGPLEGEREGERMLRLRERWPRGTEGEGARKAA
jgi:hypothetical protein